LKRSSVAERESQERPRIIVGIPAYNQEKYVGTTVLKTRQYVREVVVLDDGSTDQTARIAKLAGASVIWHQQNKGKGASIRRLLVEARKRNPDILVLMDADTQHNPDEIANLIKPISEGFDLVIGSRVRQRGNIAYYRRIGQRILSYFSLVLSRKKIFDSECGFRALSSKAIAKLKLEQNGFSVETEMIAATQEKGLKITEVPISAIYTTNGSTLNPIRHGLGVLASVITMISERRPLLFFCVPGVILIVVGFLIGLSVLNVVSFGGGFSTGRAMVSILLLLTGIFSIFTGIVLNALVRRKG